MGFIQQQNEQAFAALYERYYVLLYKKAFLRIPSVPRVEEILQDVFVTFWSKASSLDLAGNIKAYLYATLRNKILHELRTEHTRSFYMQKFKMLAPGPEECSSLQNIYVQEVEELVKQIITTLSPQCREAFTLSRFEHLSYKEIADRMQLSISTVEKHVAKALHVLRVKLNKHSDVSFILLLLFTTFP